jgi:hypothetical protein
MRNRILTYIILCIFLLTAVEVLASYEKKCYLTTRAPSSIQIDGRLIDLSWTSVNWNDDFIQADPNEFEKPTEHTLFGILYDDEAVYIGFRCYDSAPTLIDRKLRRRDSYVSTDRVIINIDSRSDQQTAFSFGLSSGGIMTDIYYYMDGDGMDDSWDPVWMGATSIDDSGWVAEIKIPYTALRFSPADRYQWGFNAVREIARKNEVDKWVVKPRKESGFVSRFGILDGIENIPQPFNMEVLPYGLSRYSSTSEKVGGDFSAGVDLKYSLNSGFVVDATVNPDFGQVEADPAVLNLGVFETYYPEKRPFFLEGSAFFDSELFYSRRIGARPQYFEPEGDIISSPEYTTILGAVKITGKNSQGISLGLMEAVTDREYAIVEDDNGNRSEELLEPYTNFFVARLMKDVLKKNSHIGFMATAVNREMGMSAYTGGFDWNLNFKNNAYNFSGETAYSDRGDNPTNRESGLGIYSEFRKSSGKHLFYLEGGTLSPGLEVNDMGFLRRADLTELSEGYTFRIQNPTWIFRKAWMGIDKGNAWNYDNLSLENYLGTWFNFQFMNYYWFNVGFNHNFERYDDLITRGGPPIRHPANDNFWLWTNTAENKKVWAGFNIWSGKNVENAWWNGYYVELLVNPIERMETSLAIATERLFDDAQWVENVTDINDSTHYLFAPLMQKTYSITWRASYNFNRDMSLQLYAQPFNAVGDFKGVVELAAPKTYEFNPYPTDTNYDFNWTNLNSNLVFRWEYAPGSILYIVWNRGMSDYHESYNFDYSYNIQNLALVEPDDIFMIKINKWFDF